MYILLNHKYKVLKTTWGISIEIIGEITDHSPDEKCCRVCNDLWCELPDRLDISEKEYIIKGLEMLCYDIKRSFARSPTVIVIRRVNYNLCDHQEDALTAAVVDTVSKALCIDTVQVKVDFDRENNKYLFDYVKNNC